MQYCWDWSKHAERPPINKAAVKFDLAGLEGYMLSQKMSNELEV